MKPAGFEPALCTSRMSPAAAFKNPSAIWLRHELPVHKIKTVSFLLFITSPQQHLFGLMLGRRANAKVLFRFGGRHLSSARHAVCLTPNLTISVSPSVSAF